MKYTLMFIYAIVSVMLFTTNVKAEVNQERLNYELERGMLVYNAFILADVMVCEASVEGRVGMLAVANVVMNRVNHPRFPNTIEKVVHQRHQFECIQKGVKHHWSEARYREAYQLAMDFLEGKTPRITKATHYYQYKLMSNPPFWATNDKYLGTIGNHKFYKVYN